MELTSIVIPQKHVERGNDWVTLADASYKLQLERKKLEEKEAHYLNLLKDLSQGISSKGGEYVFTRIDRKGIINYKDITEIQAILRVLDLEKYRGASSQAWKLERQ